MVGFSSISPKLMGSGLGLMDQLRPPKSSLLEMLGGGLGGGMLQQGMMGAAGMGAPAPAPSYGERLKSRLTDLLDPSVALPMAGAMIAGESPEESFGNAFGLAGHGLGVLKKERAAEEQKNKAMEFLRSKHPDLAGMVDAGMPVSEAWQSALKRGAGGGDVTYGLNPIWGLDDDGNPVLGTMGNDGTFKKIDTPGFQVSKTPIKMDAGTHFVLLDPVTRQPIGTIAKDIAGAAAQREIGENQGKAAASAPGDIQAGQNALDMVESLRNDPSRERGTGFSSIGNIIPGTAGKDFQTKVDQAASGAFLTAIQQMRGLGALSNAEGSAATQAITRMNTATSEEAFLAALDDYEKIVRQGMARAQARQDQFGTAIPGVEPVPQGGNTRLRYNPQTGELE